MIKSVSPFTTIVLLFVLTFFSAIIASVVSIGTGEIFATLGYSTHNNLWLDYTRLAIQTSVIFGLPAFLLPFLASVEPVSVLPNCKETIGRLLILGTLAWLFCLVPVNTLWEFNKSIVFPESMAGIEESLRQMQSKSDEYLKTLLAFRGWGNLLIIIVVVGLLPSLFEEWFFRGVLQTLMVKLSGKTWPAIVITAIVFSVFHAEFYAFLPRVLLGILLGVAYASSGKLWLPVVLHFLNNVSSVLLHQFLGQETLEKLSGMGHGWVQWAITLILLVSAGLIFRLMLRQNRLHQ